MLFQLRVIPPSGTHVPPDLIPGLRQILLNIEVAFILREEGSPQTPTIELIDTDDNEVEFVIRMLQRSGYNIEVNIPDGTPDKTAGLT